MPTGTSPKDAPQLQNEEMEGILKEMAEALHALSEGFLEFVFPICLTCEIYKPMRNPFPNAQI